MLVTNICCVTPTQRSRATRTRVLEAALGLFERQGYEATTVEQVAAAAGVSHMTVFRHFATKEALLLSDPYDPVIAGAVAAQPARLGTLERVRRGLVDVVGAMDPAEDAEARRRIRIAAGVPSLRAGIHANNEATEDAIVEALVHDGTGTFPARVAASACLGAISSALLWWGATDDVRSLRDLVVEALDVLSPASAPGGAA
jgi:AcrR family transcriptional regulator